MPTLLLVPPGGSEEGVARMVGGMKVAEGDRDAVVERERAVTEAGVEAEELGVAVTVAVGDIECSVSVAAGEAVAALEAEGVASLLGLCGPVGVIDFVGQTVGGMKVEEGETVGDLERKVSVAWMEADTLVLAEREAVGDTERAVSVAASDTVPAMGLAVRTLLPLPPTVGLRGALGVAVMHMLGERETVGDTERAVSVNAMETVPAMGLPVRTLLPLPPTLVGLRGALGVAEAEARRVAGGVKVARGEGVARMVVRGVKVARVDREGVDVRERAVSEARAEAEAMGLAVREAVED